MTPDWTGIEWGCWWGVGERKRGSECKRESREGGREGEGDRERERERERQRDWEREKVLHASSLRGGENKRPQRQFFVAVSGSKRKILDIHAEKIKAQLRLLLSRELYDPEMGWTSTGGLRRHWQRTMERWERTSGFSASFEQSSRLVSWNWPGSGLNLCVCICVCFLFITSKPFCFPTPG